MDISKGKNIQDVFTVRSPQPWRIRVPAFSPQWNESKCGSHDFARPSTYLPESRYLGESRQCYGTGTATLSTTCKLLSPYISEPTSAMLAGPDLWRSRISTMLPGHGLHLLLAGQSFRGTTGQRDGGSIFFDSWTKSRTLKTTT